MKAARKTEDWHVTGGNMGMRRNMVREIVNLMKAEQPEPKAHVNHVTQTVRRIEHMLYTNAPTKEAYEDLTTLGERYRAITDGMAAEYARCVKSAEGTNIHELKQAFIRMGQLENNAEEQRLACEAIHTSVTCPELQEVFGRMGGVRRVMRSMTAHVTNPFVVISACNAIGVLTFQSATNRRECNFATLASALRQHKDAPLVVESVLSALIDTTAGVSDGGLRDRLNAGGIPGVWDVQRPL